MRTIILTDSIINELTSSPKHGVLEFNGETGLLMFDGQVIGYPTNAAPQGKPTDSLEVIAYRLSALEMRLEETPLLSTETVREIAKEVADESVAEIDWEEALSEHLDYSDITEKVANEIDWEEKVSENISYSDVAENLDLDDKVRHCVQNLSFYVSVD